MSHGAERDMICECRFVWNGKRVLTQGLSLDPVASPREIKELSLFFVAASAQFHTFTLRHQLLTFQFRLPAGSWTPSVHWALFPLQIVLPASLSWSAPPLCSVRTGLWVLVVHWPVPWGWCSPFRQWVPFPEWSSGIPHTHRPRNKAGPAFVRPGWVQRQSGSQSVVSKCDEDGQSCPKMGMWAKSVRK